MILFFLQGRFAKVYNNITYNYVKSIVNSKKALNPRFGQAPNAAG